MSLVCAFLDVIAKIVITVHLPWNFRPKSLLSSCWKGPKPSLWCPASWRLQQPCNRRTRRGVYWKEEGSTTSLSRGTEETGNGWCVCFILMSEAQGARDCDKVIELPRRWIFFYNLFGSEILARGKCVAVAFRRTTAKIWAFVLLGSSLINTDCRPLFVICLQGYVLKLFLTFRVWCTMY